MAAIVNFYSDSQCTVPGQVIIPGVAAITGEKANVNNWIHCAWRTGLQSISRGDILVSNARDLAPVDGQIVLSGGTAIYDCSINQTIPYDDLVETDTVTEQSTGLIYNPYFISFDEEDESSFVISISATSSTEQTYNYFKFGLMYYRQTPVDASKRDRENWSYNGDVSNPLALSDLLYLFKATSQWDANMRQIKMYKVTLGDEKDYYLFAFGVTADGKYNDASNPGVLSPGTNFIAVPADYFKDKEPMPWVGPPGEDDSEEGFAPENEIHDIVLPKDIAPNDLYNANEPVLSGKGGFYVLLPNWIGESTVRTNVVPFIQTAIYRGRSEGLFNLVSQQWDEILGGTGNRNADEIQAILSAIVCCHNVPVILKNGTYLHSWHTFRTIAGYGIDLSEYNVSNVIGCTGSYTLGGGGVVFQDSYTAKLVGPRLNCFLDYEPYTQITLKLPFFPPISLPPSLVYDSIMTFRFTIDLITGFLGCDVIVNSSIFTTLTTNVKTDIPFFGTGTSGAGLSKITTAIAGAMSGDMGNAGQMFSAGLNIANEISLAGTGIAIGREGSTNLAPYFASRSAYVLITHPRAAIPVSKSGKATYLDEVGMAANLAYKVGECAGGWNKFSSVDLSTVQAPQAVKDDILAQLMQGVYIK